MLSHTRIVHIDTFLSVKPSVRSHWREGASFPCYRFALITTATIPIVTNAPPKSHGHNMQKLYTNASVGSHITAAATTAGEPAAPTSTAAAHDQAPGAE
jgi:hypothetical protein